MKKCKQHMFSYFSGLNFKAFYSNKKKYVTFIREKGLFSGRVLQPSPGGLQLPSARRSIHGCWKISQTSQPTKETLFSNEGPSAYPKRKHLNLKRISICATLFFLFFSQISFGFSEAEIDSLESSGKKSFSSRLWRTQIDVALQRNLEVSSRFSDLLDTNKDVSLLDPSNIYYILKLNLNYSLREIAKNLNFLKNGEIFLISSFNSPFSGHNNNLKDYHFTDYIQYGLGDITGGLTVPAYKVGDFLSYLSVGIIAFPLSRFSREAGLSTTMDSTVSLLYFIHKKKNWSLAFSSNHNLAYSRYKKEAADSKGNYYNIPWDSSHGGGFIYRQNRSRKWPSNIQISAVYYLGIDTKSTQNHDLTLNNSLAWKIRDRFYFNFVVKWKDRIYVYNPFNENVGKKEPIRFDLTRTFFIFGGSYSF